MCFLRWKLKAKIRPLVDNLVNTTETQPAKKRRILEITSKHAAMRDFLPKKTFENHNQNSTETQPQEAVRIAAATRTKAKKRPAQSG
jgi:hypothetical protein